MRKIYLALAAVSAAFGLICASCASGGCRGADEGKNGGSCAESPRVIQKDGAKLYEFRVGDSEFLMNPEEGALLITVHTTAVEDEMTLNGGSLHVSYDITIEGLGMGRIDYWLKVRPKQP